MKCSIYAFFAGKLLFVWKICILYQYIGGTYVLARPSTYVLWYICAAVHMCWLGMLVRRQKYILPQKLYPVCESPQILSTSTEFNF
jgi:hypothetical protein